MNLPRRVPLKISSPIFVVCWGVAHIEKCFADNGDDHWLSELWFSSRSDAKRKLHLRPIKYNFAKLTPLLDVFAEIDARMEWNRSL